MATPTVSIEAAAEGLRWKVVSADGATIATDTAATMEDAKVAGDEVVARLAEELTAGPDARSADEPR